MGFSTTAIHAGNEPDPTTGAVTVPIYQTSTYEQDGSGTPRKGYEYARTQNPTRAALERNIAALEGARFGYCLRLRDGGHRRDAPAGQGGRARHRLGQHLRRHVPPLQPRARRTTASSSPSSTRPTPLNVEAALKPNTRMVFVETPTNPVMMVTDLQAVSDIAHARRRARRLRQHLHVALPPAPDRVRRGHRRAFDDEVSQRPLGQRRRRRRPERRARRRVARLSSRTASARSSRRSTRGSSCAGRRRWPLRMEQHDAIGRGGRGLPRRAPEGAEALLSGLALAPAARAGEAAAEGFRRDGRLRHRARWKTRALC